MFRHLLLPLLFVGTLGVDADWELEIEYFEPATLSCSGGSNAHVLQFVHFWILPSGEVRRPFDKTDHDKHLVLKNNGFLLEIDEIDDADFGMYYCVVAVGRNETDVVKFGINIDGPFYGREYMDDIKSKAIVGGIAAGVVFVILAAVWILCAKCKTTKSVNDKESIGEDNKGFDKDDEVKLDIHEGEEAGTTNVQDSVYYMADGMNMEPVVSIADSSPSKGTSPLLDANRVDRLSTTDSGHYYSIGSLGRDMHPPTEADIDKLYRAESTGEPGDIYKNYVKSVHEPHLDEVSEPVLGTADEVFDTETESNGGSIRYASGIEYPISDGEASATTNGTELTNVPDNVVELYATPMKLAKKSSAYESLSGEEVGGHDSGTVENDNTQPPSATTTVVEVEIVNGNNGDDEDSDSEDAKRVEKTTALETNEEVQKEVNEFTPDTGVTDAAPEPVKEVNVEVSATDATSTTADDKSPLSSGTVTPPESSHKPSSREESTSSEVDEETIANYNSVLASLASNKLKKRQTTGGEDMRSDGPEDGAKSVEDVKL